MAKGKGGNTVAAVWEIAEPIAEELGLVIWDIRFVKEGTDWFLRIFIDKDGGVGITDCENMSRAIDKPLDEHTADTVKHVTTQEKEFWNGKVRCFVDPENEENLIFSTH